MIVIGRSFVNSSSRNNSAMRLCVFCVRGWWPTLSGGARNEEKLHPYMKKHVQHIITTFLGKNVQHPQLPSLREHSFEAAAFVLLPGGHHQQLGTLAVNLK